MTDDNPRNPSPENKTPPFGAQKNRIHMKGDVDLDMSHGRFDHVRVKSMSGTFDILNLEDYGFEITDIGKRGTRFSVRDFIRVPTMKKTSKLISDYDMSNYCETDDLNVSKMFNSSRYSVAIGTPSSMKHLTEVNGKVRRSEIPDKGRRKEWIAKLKKAFKIKK